MSLRTRLLVGLGVVALVLGSGRPVVRAVLPGRSGAGPRSRRLGLGLAIVQAVAAAHGGTAVLVSTPGAGTTVTVGIPLVTDAAGEAARASDQAG